MADRVSNKPVSALTMQFLEWLSARPRTYAETMDAWRTSCPRLSIWEDALADGLITREGATNQSNITLTSRGKKLLGKA